MTIEMAKEATKKPIEYLNTLFASKTFRFLFLAFIVGSVGLFVGKLLADQWIDLIKWLGGMATARGITENVNLKTEAKKHEIAQTVAARTDVELAGDVVSRTNQ